VLARVLCVFFLSLRYPVDAQDTSEHTGARPCPVCLFSCLFDIPWTRRTRTSTPVLAVSCKYFFFLSLQHPMDMQDTSKHTGARLCPLCLYFLSFRHPDLMDTQDTSEHTGACLCPVYLFSCIFDILWTHRTRASTLVLAHVLISLSNIPRTPRTMVSTLVLTLVMGILFLSLTLIYIYIVIV